MGAEVGDAPGLASSRDCHAQVGICDAREERCLQGAILTRWKGREERCEEIVREEQVAVTLILQGIGADADCLAFLVEVTYECVLELGDTRAALVEDQKR
jgi:hypothetical protein